MFENLKELTLQFIALSQPMMVWVLIFTALFGVLEYFWPCNQRKAFPWRAFFTDAGYMFIVPFFTRIVRIWYLSAMIFLIYNGMEDISAYQYITKGYGPLGSLPIWLQAAIIFLASDVILYWTHRWFHTKPMWPFHAIHHSSKEVYWHSTFRFHPVNVWLSFTLVDILMLAVGFSVEATALMGTFNTLYSGMVHANLNWTFGPFKYCFASPVFHRWHHTTQKEGLDKNFAPTFPLLDVIFGTFYMPEGRLPEKYGVSGSKIPESFLGQMFYPFRKSS